MGLKLSKRKKSKSQDLYITPVSSFYEDELDGSENPYENINDIQRSRDVRDSIISDSSGVSSLPSRGGHQTRQKHQMGRSSDFYSQQNLRDNIYIASSDYASAKKNFRLSNRGVRLNVRPQKKRYAMTKSTPDLTEEDDFTYYCSENIKKLRMITPDPKVNVPFMVEAFQPLIEGSVRVLEIVPYIAFIDNIERYRLIARRSPQEAMNQLITEIMESKEPGKWQTFLMALETAGYKYIVNLLKGETEADHTLQRKLLRLFTPAIMKDMNPKEFVDLLLEKDVITDADKEEIRCEGRNYGDIAASLMLLERVPKRVENWYEIFLEVLETCGLEHLVECLKPDDTELSPSDLQTSTFEQSSKHRASVAEFHEGASASFMPAKNDEPRNHDNHGHQNQNENHGHKNEIEALIAEKERLLKDIEEEKEKRQLRKEISALKKELADIKNDTEIKDLHCERENRGPEKMTRGTNTEPPDSDENGNQPMKEEGNQSDQTEKLLACIESLKYDFTKFKADIETLKEHTTNNLIPGPHSGYHYFQMKAPLHMPTPHKKRLKSASDSGIGYLSFSGERYV